MRIEPQIEVEYVDAALDLAARRPRRHDRRARACSSRAASRRKLLSVSLDQPLYDTFAFITRRDAHLSPADARVHGAGRAARRGHGPRRLARRYDGCMSHDHATVAEEEYLQTIFWLQEAGLPMTGANVARAMQLSAPTVHEMIGRLERDGYITRGADKVLAFTDDGREHAEGIVRRHRLIERFLTDVLGIPWDEVHEEAERLEHAMSPVLEARMLAAIGDAKTCPHGHPIDVGRAASSASRWPTSRSAPRSASCASRTRPRTCCTTSRTPASSPGLGRRGRRGATRHVVVEPTAQPSTVTRSVAETVSVTADPSPPPRTALPEQLVLGKDRYGR